MGVTGEAKVVGVEVVIFILMVGMVEVRSGGGDLLS